jgi:hypothetical protein
VDVAADAVGDGQAHGPAGVADLDAGEVERVEHQLHLVADEGGVDLVAVAVQAEGGGLGDPPALGPQERLAQLGRRGQGGGAGEQEALEGRAAGLGVHPGVVDALDPGGEQPVELGQVARAAAGVQLNEELLADGAEHPLDLAAALGLARRGVCQPDAKDRASPLELAGDERRAVVDVQQLG